MSGQRQCLGRALLCAAGARDEISSSRQRVKTCAVAYMAAVAIVHGVEADVGRAGERFLAGEPAGRAAEARLLSIVQCGLRANHGDRRAVWRGLAGPQWRSPTLSNNLNTAGAVGVLAFS